MSLFVEHKLDRLRSAREIWTLALGWAVLVLGTLGLVFFLTGALAIFSYPFGSPSCSLAAFFFTVGLWLLPPFRPPQHPLRRIARSERLKAKWPAIIVLPFSFCLSPSLCTLSRGTLYGANMIF